jgi:hypothetical protein
VTGLRFAAASPLSSSRGSSPPNAMAGGGAGLPFIETSAKEGTGVDELFARVAALCWIQRSAAAAAAAAATGGAGLTAQSSTIVVGDSIFVVHDEHQAAKKRCACKSS